MRKVARHSDLVDSYRTAAEEWDWDYDPISDQYKTSNLDARFSCNCGVQFEPNGFHKCACGQSWASFNIEPIGKTASPTIKIVRTVQEHRERILASKTAQTSVPTPYYVRQAPGADAAPTVPAKEQGVRNG